MKYLIEKSGDKVATGDRILTHGQEWVATHIKTRTKNGCHNRMMLMVTQHNSDHMCGMDFSPDEMVQCIVDEIPPEVETPFTRIFAFKNTFEVEKYGAEVLLLESSLGKALASLVAGFEGSKTDDFTFISCCLNDEQHIFST